mgnify:CR=1 FL=1
MKLMKATKEQEEFVDDKLTEYNQNSKPLLQERAAEIFSYSAMEGEKVVGGIFGYSSMYKIGYIDTLWVDSNYRRQGIGSQLLKQVEADLTNFGCAVVHLETFDFQGPQFYLANGYHEFARLNYPNANLDEIFLAKTLKG